MDNLENNFIPEDPSVEPETVEELAEQTAVIEESAPDADPVADLPNDAPSEDEAAQNESVDEAGQEISDGKRDALPYEKRFYMLYGGESVPESIDLSGTRDFLSQMGFNGGELSQAREGKDFAAANEGKAKNEKPGNLWCSYCGREISGVDYYRLKDGRKRCTVCSRSLVKTDEQLKRIYQRIRKNMETFFDVLIEEDVNIFFVDERKLKKKLKIQIGSYDDQSILVLGCAVPEKEGYSIYLENSAPLISITATIAHEMTHIWQFANWTEYKRKKRNKRIKGHSLEEIEGMAKWAEIQYLYLIGERRTAEREEAKTILREDEYGKGFRMYIDEYPLAKKAMTKNDTPFIVEEKEKQ